MNGCARRLPTYPFARNQTSVVQGHDANDMLEDFDNWTYTPREASFESWTYTLREAGFHS